MSVVTKLLYPFSSCGDYSESGEYSMVCIVSECGVYSEYSERSN